MNKVLCFLLLFLGAVTGLHGDTLGTHEQGAERAALEGAQDRLGSITPVLVADKDAPDSDQAAGESSAESRVTLYMTDWCGYCRKTERLLEELDVSYEAIDVEKVPGARQEKSRLHPRCGVPVTVIADTAVCGYSERKIRSLVEEMKQSESPQDGPREGEA